LIQSKGFQLEVFALDGGIIEYRVEPVRDSGRMHPRDGGFFIAVAFFAVSGLDLHVMFEQSDLGIDVCLAIRSGWISWRMDVYLYTEPFSSPILAANLVSDQGSTIWWVNYASVMH
jgi:hypothetical protein